MELQLTQSWANQIAVEFEKAYFINLHDFLKAEYATRKCFPMEHQIFSAFELCAFEDVKVVIIGQDPYHGVGQAHGLSFSVPNDTAIPPSLRNIFKEIEADLRIARPTSGNLDRWAGQGVLLLNAILTVRSHEPGSHQNRGWEQFTDAVIQKLNDGRQGLVFMLWGSYAQKKGAFIDQGKHLVLTSVHPSPLSAYRGFLGNRHFSKANHFLEERGVAMIEW